MSALCLPLPIYSLLRLLADGKDNPRRKERTKYQRRDLPSSNPIRSLRTCLQKEQHDCLRQSLQQPHRDVAGRMQEVEYRILMWTLSPEQRKKAAAREKGPGSRVEAERSQPAAK